MHSKRYRATSTTTKFKDTDMQLSDNTIFITGGTSGIGRGLAEAFHKLGNKVIISGRRTRLLEEVTAANPGMAAIQLDIADSASIEAAAATLINASVTVLATVYPASSAMVTVLLGQGPSRVVSAVPQIAMPRA